ncbi:hypothetical protein Q604_UNBC02899G0001, partial [human gut metagenome]
LVGLSAWWAVGGCLCLIEGACLRL